MLALYTAVYINATFLRDECSAGLRENLLAEPFPRNPGNLELHKPDRAREREIAVIGSEPEVYFYTHRRSATGYVYFYPLLEPQKYAVTMQAQMEAEIERAQPEIIVLVSNPKSWVAWSKAVSTDEIFAWADKYVAQYYDVVGLAETYETSTKYYWGVEAQNHSSSSPSQIYVLKRKS